ncbi:MAG: hypothetical protein P4L33_21200 [Capsulimonadaceae bacterium]|nr:hypothetical protein [Capsulimonadaceae bacterium]
MKKVCDARGIAIGALILVFAVVSIGVNRQSIEASAIDRYLAVNPGDQFARQQALLYYSGYYGDKRCDVKLRYNTIKMVEYHANNVHIVWQNMALFLQDPAYLAQIIRLLEQQKKKYISDEGYYYALAECYHVASCPLLARSSLLPNALLAELKLPRGTRLRTDIDPQGAQKSIDAYTTAIICSKRDNNAPYADQCEEALGVLLYRLGRDKDCLRLFQADYPFNDSDDKSMMLLSYGCALYNLHRDRDALVVLRQVRSADTSGINDAPGRFTMVADSTMGLIELDLGNYAEAEMYLLSAGQTAARDANWERPIELAGRLLKLKRYDTVIQFCRCATTVAFANRPEIEGLLHRALSAREATISCVTTTRLAIGTY